MVDIGTLLGWIAFALLGFWRIFWFVSAQKAEKEVPQKKEKQSLFHKKNISKVIVLIAFGVVSVQLLGVPILELPTKSLALQVTGFVLVVLGLGIAIVGRINLGSNWANCYEYQVKPTQQLVTTGIYAFIRHPLYTGILLFYIGGELIAQSYLLYAYLLTPFAALIQAKWEETVLLQHFGEKYRTYMKKTKRFIPFVW